MREESQWRIERVIQGDRNVVLRCQGDLRQIDSERTEGKTTLREMTFNLDDRRDVGQLAEIGRCTRGTTDRPTAKDPERWTGTEFVAKSGKNGTTLEKAVTRGKYRLWIPANALKLYEKVAKGAEEGLCDPKTCLLGGGTILAARWRHRTSTDIDIFWHAERWTAKQEQQAIKTWLARSEENPKATRLSPGVNKVEWKIGDTDFIASNAIEQETGRSTVVGTRLEACTTAEILAGKIYGRALIPYRDVFDAAVAVLKEPGELRKALEKCQNMGQIGQDSIERIPGYCQQIRNSGEWEANKDRYIQEPRCPEAWEDGPELVESAVQKWQSSRKKSANIVTSWGRER